MQLLTMQFRHTYNAITYNAIQTYLQCNSYNAIQTYLQCNYLQCNSDILTMQLLTMQFRAQLTHMYSYAYYINTGIVLAYHCQMTRLSRPLLITFYCAILPHYCHMWADEPNEQDKDEDQMHIVIIIMKEVLDIQSIIYEYICIQYIHKYTCRIVNLCTYTHKRFIIYLRHLS